MKVLDVHIDSSLCEGLHGILLSPAHGSMERSPPFIVLDIQMDCAMGQHEPQHLHVAISSCYMQLEREGGRGEGGREGGREGGEREGGEVDRGREGGRERGREGGREKRGVDGYKEVC